MAPITRAASSEETEKEEKEDLDATIRTSDMEASHSGAMDMRLAEMTHQIESLKAALAKLSNEREEQINSPKTFQVATPTVSSARDGNTAIADALLSLNDTLSLTRTAGMRKLYDLPDFDGRPEDWPMFKESFEMTTAECGYSDRQNLLRLQKAMKGKAKEVVESLLIHSSNVSRVMATLKERFGQPEQLVKSQLARIKSFPAIPDGQLEQLVPFATKVQNLTAFLQAAGCEHHLQNPILMEELVMKLPVQRRLEWARHAIDIERRATVQDFCSWLQQLARVLTIAGLAQNQPRRHTVGRNEPRESFFHVDEIKRGQKESCSVCGGMHALDKCARFLDMNHSQRWRVARRGKLCFNCLKCEHRSNQCAYKHECKEHGCHKSVHGLLHEPRGPELELRQGAAVGENQRRVFTSTALSLPQRQLLFKIIPVVLFANGREIECFAFLDEGSAISLINESLAKKLGLQGAEEQLTLQWFGNSTVTQNTKRVSLKIAGASRTTKQFEISARTVEDMKLPCQTLALEELHYKYRYTRNLPIKGYSSAVPELLIGVDNVHLGVAKRVVGNGWKGPAVVETKLGWVVYGPGCTGPAMASFFVHVGEEGEADLHDLVKNHIVDEKWCADGHHEHVEGIDDAKGKQILHQTTNRVGERFETGLLWRYDKIALPESRENAVKRLVSLEKRLQRDDELRRRYHEQLIEYEKKGYSRRLTPEEARSTSERTWYLPHFPVSNPSKPEKLRIVFDAAAEVAGFSLNSMLLKGPEQCSSLVEVMMKFRQRSVGVCADIVEMFHQVRIRKQDQDAQRFLWRAEPDVPVEEHVMMVMTFGATCSPCSAQHVMRRNADEYANIYPEAADAIKRNHYVDDFVHSFSSEELAIRTTSQIREVHKKGGFELKKFVSNSNLVCSMLNDKPESQRFVNLAKGEVVHTPKVLGMAWDIENDELKFTLSFCRVAPELLSGRRPTKREALRLTMSVYDPFGIAAEHSLVGKLVLQAVWREQVAWDQSISDEPYEMWLKWIQMLQYVETLAIPRCYGATFCSHPVELHVFADASELAYAAVAYWRFRDQASDIEVVFVAGKTKCAPLKLVSVPRMELQAAVLAVRLRSLICKNHDVTPSKVVMWSDSKTVLAWIKSDHRRYKPYVAHRVNEILDGSVVSDWRWLPTALNPADFGTRPAASHRDSFWVHGPAFLAADETGWPKDIASAGTDEELRNKFNFMHADLHDSILMRFSSFNRLARVIGWIMRFKNKSMNNTKASGNLTVAELEKAERIVCRAAQQQHFAEEYATLQQGQPVKRSSKLWRLNPYIDNEGLIRMSGRIDKAVELDYETRRPIILPQENHLTTLVVRHYHQLWKHQNEGTIIAEIRRKYWIPHARTVVRRAARGCAVCNRANAKPVVPIMGQLPKDRLTPFVRPFTYVGLDYMGPFLVTFGRRTEKRWIALFTCLTIRAVHMEIARDLTTDTCLLCIRNFMNRRGVPVRIRSDNATNFVGADRQLKQQAAEFDHGKIANALASRKVEWLFNCPLNPHAGGCWERLVRSAKRAMGHALYGENLQEHCLYSMMCEAENIINSRPLTHLALDSATDEPLTPNDFILGTANSEQTPHPDAEDMKVTTKLWRKVQQRQHRFWKKWVAEYLPDLCRRTKWYERVKPLAVDDVVLVCDSSVHRSKWPMGRIVTIYLGSELQVRMADVRTQTGVIKRPASMLAKLDIGES